MFKRHYVLVVTFFSWARQMCCEKAVAFVSVGLLGMVINLSAVSLVHGQEINYVNATFYVEYNNQPSQGEQRLRIQREQNTYQLEFVLDHWLVSSTQKATFTMEHCQVQPISYSSTN